MSTEGEGLDVPITGDASGLIEAFVQAGNAGANMAEKLVHVGEHIGESFKEMGAEILKMASAFVVAQVGIEGFKKAIEMAAEGMEHARQIALDSAAIGATAEQYQKLTAAASEAGVSSESMTMSMERLNASLGKAASEGGAAADKFKTLGLDVHELIKMDPEERFKAIADSIEKMGDKTAQTEAAVSIFGRSGLRLVGLLSEGAKGFDDAGEKAKKAGIILSNFDIAKVAMLAANAKESSERMETLSTMIGETLGGAITQAKDDWIDFMTETLKTSTIFQDIAGAIVYVSAIVKNIGTAFVLTYDMMKNAGENMYDAIAIIFLELGKAARIASVFMYDKFNEAIEVMKESFKLLYDAIVIVWNSIKMAMGTALTWIIDKVVSAMRTLADALTFLPGTDEMVEGIRGFADTTAQVSKQIDFNLQEGMDSAKKAVVDDTKEMGNALVKLFATVPDIDTSDIDEKIEKTLVGLENTDAAAEKAFDELGKLALPWDAASAALDNYHKKMDKLNADAAAKSGEKHPTGEHGNGLSSAGAVAYMKEVEASLVKAATAEESAAAKEAAEYQTRLDKLNEFYHDKGLVESDAQKVREQLETEHQIKMANAENSADMARLKQEAGNEHASLAQREASYNNLLRAQNEAANIAAENAFKSAEMQMTILKAQEAKDRASSLPILIDYNKQRELISQNYHKEMAIIRDNAGKEEISTEQQIADMKRSIFQGGMSALSSVLGQAAGLMDQHNRSQFAAYKVFASSQAVINALLSFSNIMGDPKVESMFGPAGQIALASTSLALGMAAAAKIASTPFGGGAGGASMGGGGSASGSNADQARAMNPAQTNVNVALYGQSFGADQVRGLIGLINQQQSQNMVVKMGN